MDPILCLFTWIEIRAQTLKEQANGKKNAKRKKNEKIEEKINKIAASN